MERHGELAVQHRLRRQLQRHALLRHAFSDISELEDWVAAGIPVIISAPWELLKPGRHEASAGHLTVCIGFTKDGDVVINDPATNLKVESVRHIYKRQDVIHAWAASYNTVYLVYPESAKIPKNRLGQWESKSDAGNRIHFRAGVPAWPRPLATPQNDRTRRPRRPRGGRPWSAGSWSTTRAGPSRGRRRGWARSPPSCTWRSPTPASRGCWLRRRWRRRSSPPGPTR